MVHLVELLMVLQPVHLDNHLNELKLQKMLLVANPLRLAELRYRYNLCLQYGRESILVGVTRSPKWNGDGVCHRPSIDGVPVCGRVDGGILLIFIG